jgi:chromosome segregation ATPase
MPKEKEKNPAPAAANPKAPEATDPPPEEQTLLAPLGDLGGDLEKLSGRVEEMRNEIEGRIAGLIETLEVKHASELEEEELKRLEVEEHLEELREERKDFEQRMLKAEKALTDVRAEMADLEERVAAERKRLTKEKTAARNRVLMAEQERDEALILVTSLTKRLQTPGIEKVLDAEEE